jgi:hypothetical protein
MIGAASITDLEADVHTDLDTLATALYVKIDDELKAHPEINLWRPAVGITPTITDAELITLSVLQPLLGHHKEARWIRHARKNLRHLFPYIPKQPGYNKRMRRLAPQLQYCIRLLAHDTDLWTHPVRIADSTPVECGRSRETAKRSALAGWAGYGYCASHSRYFWGLRLHLITTVHGLPVAFALTHPKTDERDVLVDLFELQPDILSHPDGILLTVDKGYRDTHTETWLHERNVTMIRPAYKGEAPRPGRALLHAVRQTIESVNETFKGQLGLEQHGGHTASGVMVRILQRVLALTAAIWHNWHTGQPVMRSLIAYDH